MFAAAKNLGDADGMGDLLTRLRSREKSRHIEQVPRKGSSLKLDGGCLGVKPVAVR